MFLTAEAERAVDAALQTWRQGDACLDAGLAFLHIADLSRPNSPVSRYIAKNRANKGEAAEVGAVPLLSNVPGLVMLTQTCDVVRKCRIRPFVEVAPLVEASEEDIESIRRLKRPSRAYLPNTAHLGLVADLDRTMTVEKSLVATWTRTPGWTTDTESRSFALALARKRSRFAFLDDFVVAAQHLRKRLVRKHGKQSAEGAHLRALREIRVGAAPSWEDRSVDLAWWFVKDADPQGMHVDWPSHVGEWLRLFDRRGRFRIASSVACRLEDMTAQDYVDSDHLDLDSLSTSGQVRSTKR